MADFEQDERPGQAIPLAPKALSTGEQQERLTSLLQWVLDSLPMAIWWKDRNSVFEGANVYCARECGMASPQELVGKSDYDLFEKKEEADFFRDCDRLVMETGQPQYHIIERQFKPDGRQHWLDTSKAPLRDSHGNIIGTLGTYEDITERIESEQRLTTQYNLARALSDAPSVELALPAILSTLLTTLEWDCGAIFLMDREDQMLRMKHAIAREPLHTAIYRDSRLEQFKNNSNDVARLVTRTAQPIWDNDFETHPDWLGADAISELKLRVSLAVPITFAGETHGVIELFGQDPKICDLALLNLLHLLGAQLGQFIERRRSHEELIETAQRLAQSTTPGITYQLQMESGLARLTGISGSIEQLLGYTQKEAQDQPSLLASCLSVEDNAAITKLLLESATTLRPWTKELQVTASDGTQKWVRTTCTPRLGANEVLFSGVALDITEIKEAELLLSHQAKELAESNEKLKETERLKDEFFANVSHELRTPLTLNLAPLETLLMGEAGPLTNQQKSLLTTVQTNAVRLLQIVSGLLDFSKLEAGMMEVARKPADAAGITRIIVEDFKPMAASKGIAIHLDSPSTIAVNLESYLYERIVFNLMSNALKFTQAGGSITVILRQRDNKLRLTVSDTGIGIAKNDIDHLFRKFRQLEGASTRRHEGTGLGLALVKEIAVLLGGNVFVESREGIGSKFTVEIDAPPTTAPLHNDAGERSVLSQVLQTSEHPITTQGPESKDLPKVLLAEDNRELATYMVTLLAPFANIRLASDGEEALNLALSWHPDLILTDVMMPRRDGLSLCAEVKARPSMCDVPVVLITALTHRDAMLKGWEVGADEYLFKPFHPTELVTRVRSLLKSVAQRKLAHAEMRELNNALEQKVLELASANAHLTELSTHLEQARDEALEQVETKTAFLSNMSHEIRTPLSGLIGMSEVLLRGELSDDQRSIAEVINNSGAALLDVVNHVLDFSKLEANKVSLNINEFDIRTFVESTAELFGLKAQQKNVALMTHIPADMPERFVGDEVHLRQVLLNLIANAVKFTNRGEVIVRTSIESVKDGAYRVRFAVSDTGIGIAKPNIEKLFNPFIQASDAIEANYGGTGLGLSISKQLVELMGGEIIAESVEGKGSTFHFSVPLTKVASDNLITMPPLLKKQTKVLVLDPSRSAAAILKDYITAQNIRCDVSTSGKDGILLMQHAASTGRPYDAAIVDYNLIDMTAAQLGALKNSTPGLSATKMVLCTAVIGDDAVKECLNSGFAVHITKPFRSSRLIECLEILIDRPWLQVSSPQNSVKAAAANIIHSFASKQAGASILIVEDTVINQQVCFLLLKQLGLVADIVTNGKEAVAAVKQHRYSMVLMDCQMPEMDGYTATRLIRQHEAEDGIRTPIVALTAHGLEQTRLKCLQNGMDDYLTKPVTTAKLVECLRKWLPNAVADSPESAIASIRKAVQ